MSISISTTTGQHATASALRAFLSEMPFERGSAQAVGRALRALIDMRLDRPPLPGHGDTAERWRALGAVAAFDLSLVKLYEGHTDALAILAELAAWEAPEGSAWAVWAAEPPNARVSALGDSGADTLRLQGTKAWCSGAASVTHALVSAWNEQDEPVLAAVELNHPGVRITDSGWRAVGMHASMSLDVHFEQVPARRIGLPRAYLERPGFWQGGAGIAACWFGAAAAIAEFVARDARHRAGPYKLAHLGAIDTTLRSTAALLRETATFIDRHPQAEAATHAMRARLAAEQAAVCVVERAGRALGAGPLCRDAHFAQLMADLPIFIRQSHAERDEASLAERVIEEEQISWQL
ncbi:acyl-CoA dehydrogenase family protein [Caballeronia insecticola]|uniref:Putative acyl-CoA dehydrogenase-related protein n=1 Tax=Caballeronia insecticola TaxID=758793 RepID=R4WEU5_9BURK|nr:acyl-CoA dehydrogenase-related protein [Caballeronia insecticola]BAN21829.1 putative acyl-CoA dehydrogenase-related protein [Caballeronia insecticola]